MGYGHLYRCAALAEVLRTREHEIILFTSSDDANFSKHYRVIRLPTNDKRAINNKILKMGVDVIINDILDTSTSYMRYLNSLMIKSINFDDLGNGSKYATANIIALRKAHFIRPKKHLNFHGPKYLVIRNPFSNNRSGKTNRNITDM